MALLGKGLLAIWNGITDSGEAEFVKWHIREHIPERVGLSGFLRGRRYVAHQGHPKYFNFYETKTPQTLESTEYRARLNAPTQWTKDVVKEFRDTSRTICEVIASMGLGEGAWIETIQISGMKDRETFARRMTQDLMPDVARQDGIIGVHFVRGVEDQVSSQTAESSFLETLRNGACSNESIHELSADVTVERGIYRLQYGLTHGELGPPD